MMSRLNRKFNDIIADYLKRGKITQEQADLIKAKRSRVIGFIVTKRRAPTSGELEEMLDHA